jgi:glycosyltransferase involved in cell wall biosynthesis
MHILLIHQSFVALDEPGGTRHYELARYLVEQGHRVTVIASPVSYLTGAAASPSARETSEGIVILRSYTYRALHKSFVHRVFSFLSFMLSSFWNGLKVKDVDVVWGTSPPIFQAATAWALARLKGAKFLLEIRDLWPAFAIAVGVLRSPLLIRLSEWLERCLYRHADRLMINSPGFREHLQARGAKHIDLVPNGADPRMFDPRQDGAPFRQAHDLEGKFVLLYAGAHGISNDLGVLLRAAHLLQEQARDSHQTRPIIVLLGDGKEKASLQQQAAESGLQNVLFLPPVAKSQMSLALAGADACIAILKPISLYATVYPNKVFDYMAAGKAVLLAIDGVIRQVIEEAGAGVFAPPGDAERLAETLWWMAQNPLETRQMGENGRRYVEEHFDRAVLADQLTGILVRLTSQQK